MRNNNNIFIDCFPPYFFSASNTPYVPLLSWKKAQDSVPWNIILLLGGGFAMAKACEVSLLFQSHSSWTREREKERESMSPLSCLLCAALLRLILFSTLLYYIEIWPLTPLDPVSFGRSPASPHGLGATSSRWARSLLLQLWCWSLLSWPVSLSSLATLPQLSYFYPSLLNW